jgi:hypothetical protein
MASRDYSGGCSDDRGAKFAHFPAHSEAFDLRARANTVKAAKVSKIGLFLIPPKGPKNQIQKQQHKTRRVRVVVNIIQSL